MDKRNGSFREMKKLSFGKANEKSKKEQNGLVMNNERTK